MFTVKPGSDTPQSVIDAINEVTGNNKPKPTARIQKDQFVMPTVGPHKGQRHKVTKIHEDGSMTIIPWDIHPSKCQYRMGAAKATADQVEAIEEAIKVADNPEQQKKISKEIKDAGEGKETEIEESKNTPSVKPFSHPGSDEQAGWKAMNKHGKTKFFGLNFKAAAHRHAGIDESVESLAEMSKDKVHRYFDRAASAAGKAEKKGDTNTARKRMAGLQRAYKKITENDNEESEVKPITEGRPPKGMEGQEHVVMQMRKNITMNGSKPVKFADGSSHPIASGHAQRVVDHYNSIAKPDHKDQFQKHIGSSHRNFSDWIGGKKFEPTAPSTEKPKSRGINNDEIFGSKSLRESSTIRTVKSLRYRQQLQESREARAKFRARLADLFGSA